MLQTREQASHQTHLSHTHPGLAPDCHVPGCRQTGATEQSTGGHSVGLRQVQGERLPRGTYHRAQR